MTPYGERPPTVTLQRNIDNNQSIRMVDRRLSEYGAIIKTHLKITKANWISKLIRRDSNPTCQGIIFQFLILIKSDFYDDLSQWIKLGFSFSAGDRKKLGIICDFRHSSRQNQRCLPGSRFFFVGVGRCKRDYAPRLNGRGGKLSPVTIRLI